MASLIAMSGLLYGTTSRRAKRGDYGTVFVVDTGGLEKVLYSFKGGSDGAYPGAALTKENNTLYGTTDGGGTEGYGTIFSVTAAGQERVLYSFQAGSDGANPVTKLLDLNGTLYGTTSSGGYSCGCGTVFTITTAGKERVVYRFQGGRDGANPGAYLTPANGLLYGTTKYGGSSGCSDKGCGTVFSIDTAGNERVLYRFQDGNGDGAYPESGLTKLNGLFFGTTDEGDNNAGTVFSLTTDGQERVLSRFEGGSDGADPEAHLTNLNGVLYGTTASGGLPKCGYYSSQWCGTVFSVTTAGKKSVLYRFKSRNDGMDPHALFPVDGTLYGTTQTGGQYSQGTIFALTP